MSRRIVVPGMKDITESAKRTMAELCGKRVAAFYLVWKWDAQCFRKLATSATQRLSLPAQRF
jgi:riboflavin synthase